MSNLFLRLAIAAAAPLLLVGCLLTPGKFTSTLSIGADRHFAFTYQGEVYAAEEDGGMGKLSRADDTDGDDATEQAAFILTGQAKDDDAKAAAAKKAATEAKRREVAVMLAKETGFRSVKYVGDGKYLIDYAISGTLDHAFVWPFNSDAEIVLPFVAVELRGKDLVRLRAPAFAKQGESAQPMPGMGDASSKLDGVFTLDTDAEIVSQNNEDGPKIVAGRKTITWRATPLTKDAPVAVLRMK